MFVGYKRRAVVTALTETEPRFTLHEFKGTGTARKFELNTVAGEALGVSQGDYVTFGWQEDDENLYLYKVDREALAEDEQKYAFRLTKELTFSNKGAYESIAEDYSINPEEGGNVNVEITEIDGVNYLKMVVPTEGEPELTEEEKETWKNGI